MHILFHVLLDQFKSSFIILITLTIIPIRPNYTFKDNLICCLKLSFVFGIVDLILIKMGVRNI